MTTPAPDTPPALQHTPLHDLNVAHGARMVAFAGYAMPVQFPPGVLKEHLHTRAAAGLFDVSHMGQIVLRAKSGNVADAAAALERLVPADIAGLPAGRQRYALFTNAGGGILDDLMVANRGSHLFLIVNAACKVADEAHLRAHLAEDCEIEPLDRALIALQGPQAAAVLAALAPEVSGMRFMDVRAVDIAGAGCIVSRSGYTGEDGFEISVPNDAAVAVAETLLANTAVAPIGLGARDSLRLEAGLCLYGSDLDIETTPVEAALEWAIGPARRHGARRAGFPGADVILDQLQHGAPRRRVGLSAAGRMPVRAPAPLFLAPDAVDPIGYVSSGGFGPSLDAPVAMGYLPATLAKSDTAVFAEVRGKRVAMAVTPLPFVPARFHRG